MKIIYTSKGQEILVDDEDYEELNAFPWHVVEGYAMRHAKIADSEDKEYKQSMHRQIFGLSYGDPDIVDHWNLNRLDNQRNNLRRCNTSQNAANSGLKSTNTSGFKGVYLYKRVGKYLARIRKNGKRISLGYYDTAEEGYAAYRKAAAEIHGEFFLDASIGIGVVTDDEGSSGDVG